jgi:hypothetical protein
MSEPITYHTLKTKLIDGDARVCCSWLGKAQIKFTTPNGKTGYVSFAEIYRDFALADNKGSALQNNPHLYTYTERKEGFLALKRFYDLTREPVNTWYLPFHLRKWLEQLLRALHYYHASYWVNPHASWYYFDYNNYSCCFFTEQELEWKKVLPYNANPTGFPNVGGCVQQPPPRDSISGYPSHSFNEREEKVYMEVDGERRYLSHHFSYEQRGYRLSNQVFYYAISFFENHQEMNAVAAKL